MWIKKFFDFILFGSIFISCCTVAFCMQTNILLGLPLNHFAFYVFVFGATLTHYNLHYVAKKVAVVNSERLHWTMNNFPTHFILIAIGVGLIIYSLTTFQLQHFLILILLGAIAVVYSFPVIPFGKRKRIKDYGILKITTLTLLWTLVTVWFPVNLMPFDGVLFTVIFIKRFVFMFLLCLLFDIRDAPVDESQNIKTLAVWLGKDAAYKLCFILLWVFVIFSVGEAIYFEGHFLGAFIISAIATGLIIQYSKKNNDDITCLAGVDGMMLLQALLVYLFSLKL